MILESCENVASKWASCGDANSWLSFVQHSCSSINYLLAMRKRGGGQAAECPEADGLDAPGLMTVFDQHSMLLAWVRSYLRFSFFSEGSYMMVLCSRLRRSNMRTLPSAPQLTKTSTLFAQKRTSYTSLSCAMS